MPAFAGPDGGWDVELADAGTSLPAQMAVMTPGDAQNLDVYLRTAEKDRDGYRTALVVTAPIAVLATVAAIVLSAAYAAKK